MTDRRAIVERLNQYADDIEMIDGTEGIEPAEGTTVKTLRDAAALIGGTCATCEHFNGEWGGKGGASLCGKAGMHFAMPSQPFGCTLWTPADPTPRPER